MKAALYMISNFVLADRVQSMAGMSISVDAEDWEELSETKSVDD